MNKLEMIERIARQTEMAKKDVRAVVNGVIEAMGAALSQEERVHLTGLGTFEVRTGRARKARNLYTNEAIDVPAKKRVMFRSSAKLQQRASGVQGESC